MEKKTNHKLVTRQNKNPEPIDKTEEQNPGEDGRMRRSAENGDSIYDPDGSAVKPGKEGTYQNSDLFFFLGRAELKNKAGRACGPEEDARKLCPRMKKLSEAFFDGQDVVQ